MEKDYKIEKQIRELVSSKPCSYSTILQHGAAYENALSYIFEMTCFLPDDLAFSSRVWHLLSGRMSMAKCKVCGRDIPHGRKCHAIDGYSSMCCSRSCAQVDPDHKERTAKSNMAKYGVSAVQRTDWFRNMVSAAKKTKTDAERARTNQKRRATCLAKYGTEYAAQSSAVREKIAQAAKNRPPEEESRRLDGIRRTKLSRYGDASYVNSEKARQTRLTRAQEDPEFNAKAYEKRKRTCMERYGVDNAALLEQHDANVRLSQYVKSFNEMIAVNEHVTPLFDAPYYAAHRHDALNWRCKACGREFSAKMGEQRYFPARCTACHPLHDPYSKPEHEFADFIRSIYGGTVIENTRSVIGPNELDVYLPDLGLAFEFDGMFWHSEDMGTPRLYHVTKTDRCREVGVTLIHVFESEWVCRNEITRDRVSNILGVYGRTVFARKCAVAPVGQGMARAFLDDNHIQGSINASVRLGLFDGAQLVSLMMFSKCRFDSKHQWELSRFCCRLGCHVPGAAGKLLRHFEKAYRPKSVVTYADRRWSTGRLYSAIGFELGHVSAPDYWYWKHSRGVYMPESRMKYQKSRLPAVLDKFDPAKSERQNMKDNGYFRIYDCGNMVFEKTY